MTQNWTDDVFASSHNAQTDLQNMENNFQTLKTLFAGSGAPANTEQGLPWFDTGKDLLRLRNAANGSWYGVMHADASQQIWVYRNDAMSGWVVVTSVTDKVLAIKGGSQAYDVTGGTTAGTWQQPGHALSNSEMPSHDHYVSGSTGTDGGHDHSINLFAENTSYNAEGPEIVYNGKDQGFQNGYIGTGGNHSHSFSTNSNSAGGDSAHDHGSGWRPAAAVGTMQRMDV
jgi:hypothetical protein